MTRHRTDSIAFKRQVAQDYLAGVRSIASLVGMICCAT